MLQGEIFTFPLNDLIQWLAFTRRTGQLSITHVQGQTAAQAQAGVRIPTSPSGSSRVRLQLYFLEGAIAGAEIAGRGVATEGQQIRSVLTTALTWRMGHFSFSTEDLPNWVQNAKQRFSAERLLQAAAPPDNKPAAEAVFNFGDLTKTGSSGESLTLAEHLRLYAVNRISQGDFKVPALPDLAVRVLELTSDENFSLRTLGDLVIKDQAVAAQVLRYANSPLYGYSQRVESLDQAVQLIGAGEVVNIVLAAAIQSQRYKNDRFSEEKNLLWKHSSAAAFIARTIALQTEYKSSLAFMCSLLMDLGTTVLYSIFQSLLERTSAKSLPPQIVETLIWEYHPRVGRVVGEQWRLPQTVIETMAFHHCLEENYYNKPFVAITALADYLATLAINTPRISLKQSLERFSPTLLVNHPAGKIIKLNVRQANEILLEIPQNLRQSQEFILT